MRIKLIKLLAILTALVLIFLNLTIPSISLTKAGVSNSAQEVALEFLKEQSIINPKLSNATVDFPCVYTDKSLHKHFIVYAIKKYESIIGRIVLLKTKDKYVVLEMGETPPPNIAINYEIPKYIPLKEGEIIGQAKFIYVFPLLYFVHFNILKDGKLSRDIYFYWNEKREVSLDEIPEQIVSSDSSSSKTTSNPVALNIGSSRILWDVPDFIMGDMSYPVSTYGCGPVAGANILGYWSRNGYPNLWNEGSDPKGVGLATSLYYYMGTWYWGTPSVDFARGIESYSQDFGYTFSCHIDSEAQVYGSFVREINNERPLGVRIQLGGLLDQHWITGIGYYYGYSGYYVYVRDGWHHGYAMINWDNPFLGNDPITSFIDNVYVYPGG